MSLFSTTISVGATPKSSLQVLRTAWCAALLRHQKTMSPKDINSDLLSLRDAQALIQRAEQNLAAPVKSASINDLYVDVALPDIHDPLILKLHAPFFANARRRLKTVEDEFVALPVALDTFRYSQTLIGREAILAYLQRVREAAVGWTKSVGPQLDKIYPFINKNRLYKHGLRLGSFFAGYTFLTGVTAFGLEHFGWPGMVPPLTVVPFVAPRLTTWTLEFWSFLRAVRHPALRPEYEKRLNYAEGIRFIERADTIEAFLQSPPAGREPFFLLSTTELISKADVTEMIAAQQEGRSVSPEFLLRKVPADEGGLVLLIDELIFLDPATHDPKLVTFLRWRSADWLELVLERKAEPEPDNLPVAVKELVPAGLTF